MKKIICCPYCGAGKDHIEELNHVEGHLVESVAVWCRNCDEQYVVDRNVDEDWEEL